ncbi:hypothetical protein JDV02_000712 [Purpureocillium takamizusanense]|uniref:Uncharacterized protein n=1 Tax=Purpureocillium takamizusanense TaxID=2060973 RepID=A0A9Q8V748_9HYPO|nr:uncharacterized protein JDV02_000712 [Purpureocillium takamizusanense]UNI14031.1 hypothetical protein JDV02_000712 [Purpureocillium takamizusanense]
MGPLRSHPNSSHPSHHLRVSCCRHGRHKAKPRPDPTGIHTPGSAGTHHPNSWAWTPPRCAARLSLSRLLLRWIVYFGETLDARSARARKLNASATPPLSSPTSGIESISAYVRNSNCSSLLDN